MFRLDAFILYWSDVIQKDFFEFHNIQSTVTSERKTIEERMAIHTQYVMFILVCYILYNIL